MATSHCQALADAAALAAAGAGPIVSRAGELGGRIQQILDANALAALPATYRGTELVMYAGGDTVPGYGVVGANDEALTVPIHVTAQYRFGRAMGLTMAEIVRAATALRQPSGAGGLGVVLALETSSSKLGIDMSGSGAFIDGPVHSNTKVNISGSRHHFSGVIEYRNKFTLTGSGHTLDAGYTEGSLVGDPTGWTPATFAPYDYEIWGNYNVPSSGVVPPGCYRVHGNVHVSGSNQVLQNVTFVADGSISFSGSGHIYTPNRLNVFAYSLSTDTNGAVNISGSRPGCFGTLYAPNGNLDFSGSDMVITRSSLIGKTIDISGSDYTLRPSPTFSDGAAAVRLIK